MPSDLTAAERAELRAEHHFEQVDEWAPGTGQCYECRETVPCRVMRLDAMLERAKAALRLAVAVLEAEQDGGDTWMEDMQRMYNAARDALADAPEPAG